MDLSSLNSEFVNGNGNGTRGRHVKKIEGRLLYPFYVFVMGLFLFVFLLSVEAFVIFLLAVIATSVYFGLQGYGEYQLFAGTPVAKIDGAANELTEIQANIYPYKDPGINLPIGEGKCAFCGLELHYATGETNSQDYILSSHYFSSASLLFDGTGYLYGDYNSAEFEMPLRIYELQKKKFEWVTNRDKIIQAFDDTTGIGKQLDIGKYDTNLTLAPIGGEKIFRASGQHVVEREPSGYYVKLYYVPIDRPYFIIGNISDSGKLYNEKPLKMFSVDQTTGILAITARSKKQLISRLRNYAFLDIALALLCFVALVWIFNMGLL